MATKAIHAVYDLLGLSRVPSCGSERVSKPIRCAVPAAHDIDTPSAKSVLKSR